MAYSHNRIYYYLMAGILRPYLIKSLSVLYDEDYGDTGIRYHGTHIVKRETPAANWDESIMIVATQDYDFPEDETDGPIIHGEIIPNYL